MASSTVSTVYSTQIVHIGSGASLASNAISLSTDISTALASTNMARYALADLAVFISNSASVSSASNTVIVRRRDINFDGANDEPIPSTATSAAWSGHIAGVLTIPPYSVASTSYHKLTNVEIPDGGTSGEGCEFYIENRTNSSITAGWTIKVTPKSDAIA